MQFSSQKNQHGQLVCVQRKWFDLKIDQKCDRVGAVQEADAKLNNITILNNKIKAKVTKFL